MLCLGEPTAMKPPVERMGLEEEHSTGKNKRVRPEGLCLDGAKQWQEDLGLGFVPKKLQAPACPDRLSCSPVHCTLLQLPRDCACGSAHLLLLTPLPQAGWAGSASEAAQSSFPLGKISCTGSQEGKRGRALGSPVLRWSSPYSALVVACCSPSHLRSALVSKSLPSLLAKAHQHNSLDRTIYVPVCR